MVGRMADEHVLRTERLLLRLLSIEETEALLEGRRDPERPWSPGYPLDGTLVAAAMVVQHHEGGAAVDGFAQYQVIRLRDGLVIGDIGFHGPPSETGDVSIGFGIVPGARGQGFATEALRGLLDWALAQPGVTSVHADTDFVNIAAAHVLAAAGMRLVADEGDRKVYEAVAQRTT
jgi:[ribosomal protein S5]-alanine N-acetyltransferase